MLLPEIEKYTWVQGTFPGRIWVMPSDYTAPLLYILLGAEPKAGDMFTAVEFSYKPGSGSVTLAIKATQYYTILNTISKNMKDGKKLVWTHPDE